MKIIKEFALLLILVAFSRIFYINGQLITNNVFKGERLSSKEYINESSLRHKRNNDVYDYKKFSTAFKTKGKRSLVLLNDSFSLSFFLEINQIKDDYYINSLICNIKNCFMPHGVCIGDSVCKCSRYYGNLFMIDLTEKIKIKNSENFISKLLNQNDLAYYLAEYFRKKFSESFCAYQKKSQLIAFLLEFIFLMGIGHFYLNRFFHGFYKIFLIIFIILVWFSMKKSKIEIKFFLSFSHKLSSDCLLNFLFFILVGNFIFIHIIDVIMIASNRYKDGFGFHIISWNSRFCNN